MYRVPPAGRWWPAVGAPLERGVRQHWLAAVVCLNTSSFLFGPANHLQLFAEPYATFNWWIGSTPHEVWLSAHGTG